MSAFDLPFELWSRILSFGDRVNAFVAQFVSREFKAQGVGVLHDQFHLERGLWGSIQFVQDVCKSPQASIYGGTWVSTSNMIPLLQWANRMGCPLGPYASIAAASAGKLDTLQWLSSSLEDGGADIELPVEAFNVAAQNGHVSILDIPPIRTIQDYEQRDISWHAALGDHPDTMEFLWQDPLDLMTDFRTSRTLAEHAKDPQTYLKMIWWKGDNQSLSLGWGPSFRARKVNNTKRGATVGAARAGRLELFTWLVAGKIYGGDVVGLGDRQYVEACREAAYAGKLKMVQHIHTLQRDLIERPENMLPITTAAAQMGQLKVVEYLLDIYEDNQNNFPPPFTLSPHLKMAPALYNHPEILQLFLDRGFINRQMDEQWLDLYAKMGNAGKVLFWIRQTWHRFSKREEEFALAPEVEAFTVPRQFVHEPEF